MVVSVIASALLLGLCRTSRSAVNVYFSSSAPTSLTDQFIADVTTQYQATVVLSKFQPGSYTVTVNAKNPQAVCGGTIISPCDLDADIQLMVSKSTETYLYGYRDGETDERARNLGTASWYVMQCSSASVFGASTSTWNAGTCNKAIMAPVQDIYQQTYSTPMAISGH